jgi:hypothetical protein
LVPLTATEDEETLSEEELSTAAVSSVTASEELTGAGATFGGCSTVFTGARTSRGASSLLHPETIRTQKIKAIISAKVFNFSPYINKNIHCFCI